jgi:hypothetical protein
MYSLVAHTRRRQVAIAFIAVDVLLFIGAIFTSYLSENHNWLFFFGLSTLLTTAFIGTRAIAARPRLQKILAFEDAAARVANQLVPYGIERVYNMQKGQEQSDRNADTVARIKSAAAMWLCANSGASYLDPGLYRHWPTIEERLRKGVPFKVVLLDPRSPEKAFRNLLNVGSDADDSKLNLRILVRLYNEHNSLELRLVKHGMHATVFATDEALFYDPYHVAVVGHRIENRAFCLKISPAKPAEGLGYYDLFRSHFDSLWRESQDFESWLDEHAADLAETMSLKRRHSA